jgi:hypothetical protein
LAQPKAPGLGPVSWAGLAQPTYLILYYIYYIKKNEKKFQKISKIISKTL